MNKMMTNMEATPPHINKFQQLLRELFQFDCADLDFGIYRIMNYKRDAIEEFITETLPRTVADELARGPLAQEVRAVQELEEAAHEVHEMLGDYIDAQGNLDENYHGTTVGSKYLNAKEKVDSGASKSRENVEVAIFNHLYTFFSRYYQDGDFISKRRYSKRQRYAIPYNGEEVYLHWANSDQYYIKTAEHFHDYTWRAPNDVAVHFKLVAADIEQNNVKGEKRFFLPLDSDSDWDPSIAEVIIPFAYRPLTQEEKQKYGSQKQQDKIIADAVKEIPQWLDKATPAQAALTRERERNGKGEIITYLEYHLRQYTRRNTSDFFIHKDLRGFLARELDFYLKNEVLNLDEMENAGQELAEGWFQMLRLIKSVGGRIIDFLDQVECFQKMLWEKRKFIIETGYCIRVGIIDERFYSDIAACDTQWNEWKDQFDIDEVQDDLFNSGISQQDRRLDFLKTRPALVVDTKHFGQEFVDRLLGSLDDLDRMTDGVLVHSENWQALSLLQEKYRKSVKCAYIDPPYNTAASEILYKNDYKHSSWLSLIANRLNSFSRILVTNGILCVAIDDSEYHRLYHCLTYVFTEASILGTVVVRSNPAGRSALTGFSVSHDYALFVGADENCAVGQLLKTVEQIARYDQHDDKGRFEWVNFRKHGGLNANRAARPKLFYPIYASVTGAVTIPSLVWDHQKGQWATSSEPVKGETLVYPINAKGEEKTWKWGHETAMKRLTDLSTKPDNMGKPGIYMKSRMTPATLPSTLWVDKKYSATDYGTNLLAHILGYSNAFSFPKSVYTVADCLRVCQLHDNDCCIDFFAGSGTTGHAVINLNREDGRQRKFILVEMGDYFDTVLLPRIKKVSFAPEWKDGKPKRMATPEEAERSPRIVKYIRLESYEDALNNIEIDDRAGQAAMRFGFDDYLLKYMLNWETKQSETFLNVEKLVSPFSYQLNIHVDGQTRARTADVPETFNYLLGLMVRTRRVHDDSGRRYLVYQGETRENPGQVVAVIWRETADWGQTDFERDKQFVAENNLADGADVIYVNGDSFIPNAKALEPLFKSRMFAGVQS